MLIMLTLVCAPSSFSPSHSSPVPPLPKYHRHLLCRRCLRVSVAQLPMIPCSLLTVLLFSFKVWHTWWWATKVWALFLLPAIPPLSLLLPLCSEMCVASNSLRGARAWSCSDMSCHFRILNDLVDIHSSMDFFFLFFFFTWPLFRAHLAFCSPLCWVSISSHLFFLIIPTYCTFWCFMMMWFKRGNSCIHIIRV